MRTVEATIAAVTLALDALTTAASAEDKLTPQQEKMKAGNAPGRRQERRRAEGVHVELPEGRRPNDQQEKMKKCNADTSAKALKGDERKSFMSECGQQST